MPLRPISDIVRGKKEYASANDLGGSFSFCAHHCRIFANLQDTEKLPHHMETKAYRGEYVAPEIDVIELKSQRVLCTSTGDMPVDPPYTF